MARIAGINIPDRQHTEIGLTAIYGIGRARARAICDAAGIAFSKKVKDLSDAEMDLQMALCDVTRQKIDELIKKAEKAKAIVRGEIFYDDYK